MKAIPDSDRNFLQYRPLCCFGAVFLSVSFAASFFSGDFKWILAAGIGLFLLILLILFAILRYYTAIRILLVVSACVPALLLSYFGIDRPDTFADSYGSEPISCEMIVTDCLTRSSGRSVHEVLLTEADNRTVRVRAILETPYDSYLDVGDQIRLPAILSRTRSRSLSENYTFADGFSISLSAPADSTPELIAVDVRVFPYTYTAKWAGEIGVRIGGSVDSDSGALIRSLLCGDKSGLSVGLKNQISALGISHLFAVSGMHIGILIAFLSYILQSLRLKKTLRTLICLIGATLYLGICSFSPSICRAFGMFLILSVATLTGRRSDPLTALFAAGCAVVALSPYRIQSIGFLLSFLATLGILGLGIPLCRRLSAKYHGIFYRFLSALILTFSAKLFTLPISVLCFGSDSLISPISTLIFSVLIGVILSLSPFLLLFSYFQPLGIQFGKLVSIPCKTVGLLAKFAGNQRFEIYFRHPALQWGAVAVFAAVILILLFCRRRFIPCLMLYLGYIAAALLVGLLLPLSAPRILPICDSNDDALLISDGNRAILLDNSSGGYTFWSECLKTADSYGLQVDTLLLTHYHNYQPSGLSRLLSGGQIQTLLLPDDPAESEDAGRLAELAKPYGVQVKCYGGQSVVYRDCTIRIYRGNLTRSAHLCTAFFVEDTDGSALYFGSGVTECDDFDDFLAKRNTPETVYPGCHGPTEKAIPRLPQSYENCDFLPMREDWVWEPYD